MNVLNLPLPNQDPIAQFVRIGYDHRQMDELLAAGRFPVDRTVFRAALISQQADLLAALRAAGRETVLDTGVIDLVHPWRYKTNASNVPWSAEDRPLNHADITKREFALVIARFVVEHGFDAVLSPTHYLENVTDGRFEANVIACKRLREALDREGGRHIAIDYHLSIAHTALRDPAQRTHVIQRLANLPAQNLWLHVSPFGITSSAAVVRRFIETVYDLLVLKTPIIVDGVAGLPALALLAFGAAGGIAHGVTQHERFTAPSNTEPKREKGRGGSQAVRALLPALDCQLSRSEYDLIVAAPGGRRAIACADRSCCPRGLDDTWAKPKAHYLRQRRLPLENLANIPNLRRAEHFLNVDLTQIERKAREIGRLKILDEKLKLKIDARVEQIEKFYGVFTDLQESGISIERSRAPLPRVSAPMGIQRRRT
jgi:hypothetical protein